MLHDRSNFSITMIVSATLAMRLVSADAAHAEISVADYPNIQAAVDANPGREIHVSAGDHVVDSTIRISGTGTSLIGTGRIVMNNPDKHILEIEHARQIRIAGITLTRSEGRLDTEHPAVLVSDAQDIVIEQIKVIDNRARTCAIRFSEVRNGRILNCDIRNYMTITVDDRTQNVELLGYAFRCVDGTGIVVDRCQGTLIQGNTIIENVYRPTPELKAQHRLGSFTKKNPTKGLLISQDAWDAEYVNNWHQGSALIVTGPTFSKMTRIIGNQIENAAQGIDIHSDHVIISNNIVDNCFIGTKAMHGSRNVLITGNHFSRSVLWAIGLMSGSGAAPGIPASGDKPAVAANFDGGSLITDNIISQFGYGDSYWMWQGSNRAVIRFDRGQESSDPPLRDVLIQGNIISNPDSEELPELANQTAETPRYHYAVLIEQGTENSPRGLHFGVNLFPAGINGVSNVDLSKP